VTTHLYCVLPNERRGELPTDLRGIEGARVRAMQVEGLVAWISDAWRTAGPCSTSQNSRLRRGDRASATGLSAPRGETTSGAPVRAAAQAG